jgi:hydrogenase/urease accessory protein HupE
MKLKIALPGLLMLAPSIVYADPGIYKLGFKATVVHYLTHPDHVAWLASMGLIIVGAIAMVRRVKSLRQYRQGGRHDRDID